MTTFTNESFYFGCWSEPGHFLYASNGRRIHERHSEFPKDFPVREHVLDGGLLGICQREDEGVAALSHIGKWTILSFWDRSIDSRGACNSNFIMRGKLEFDDAVKVAREKFPTIFARFKFPICPRD
jgi:hypothetical protein